MGFGVWGWGLGFSRSTRLGRVPRFPLDKCVDVMLEEKTTFALNAKVNPSFFFFFITLGFQGVPVLAGCEGRKGLSGSCSGCSVSVGARARQLGFSGYEPDIS